MPPLASRAGRFIWNGRVRVCAVLETRKPIWALRIRFLLPSQYLQIFVSIGLVLFFVSFVVGPFSPGAARDTRL